MNSVDNNKIADDIAVAWYDQCTIMCSDCWCLKEALFPKVPDEPRPLRIA